jgi:hypothetical protein
MGVEDRLDFLYNLFEKELQLQSKLLDYAREKKRCLLGNDMEKLSEILEEEGEIVFQAKETEAKIKRSWKEIVLQMGLEGEELSVSRLAVLAGEGRGERFLLIQQRLRDTLTELRRVNEENAIIIRDTLNYIEVLFSIILREFDKNERSCGYFGSGWGRTCGIIIDGVM